MRGGKPADRCALRTRIRMGARSKGFAWSPNAVLPRLEPTSLFGWEAVSQADIDRGGLKESQAGAVAV